MYINVGSPRTYLYTKVLGAGENTMQVTPQAANEGVTIAVYRGVKSVVGVGYYNSNTIVGAYTGNFGSNVVSSGLTLDVPVGTSWVGSMSVTSNGAANISGSSLSGMTNRSSGFDAHAAAWDTNGGVASWAGASDGAAATAATYSYELVSK
jgi:hypothetical protein